MSERPADPSYAELIVRLLVAQTRKSFFRFTDKERKYYAALRARENER